MKPTTTSVTGGAGKDLGTANAVGNAFCWAAVDWRVSVLSCENEFPVLYKPMGAHCCDGTNTGEMFGIRWGFPGIRHIQVRGSCFLIDH